MVPGCGRAADLDHRAQLRQPRRLQFARRRRRQFRQQRVQHPHVVGGLERGRRDQRGAADFCQREFQFAEAIGGIDGDENEAGLGGGKLRQRPFRPVQRPHPDAGAAFQPEREKARRQRIDPLGQFSPIPPDVMARRHQRLALRPAPRRLIQACARWCHPAAAHRRCRRRSYPLFRSSQPLHAPRGSITLTESINVMPGLDRGIQVVASPKQRTGFAHARNDVVWLARP